MTRDIRKDPQPGDTVHQTYTEGWGVPVGKHTYHVRRRTPRKVRVQHVWPDGIETMGHFWLSEWRRLTSPEVIA